MRSFFLFVLFFLVSNIFFSAKAQEFFPKGLTEEEKENYDEFIRTYSYGDKNTQPPALSPRTPAEFEEAGGVIVSWTSYTYELREIVKHAKTRVPVYIVADNASSVQSYLSEGGVSMDNITIVNIPFNSVWVRDYGPQSTYLQETDELAFVDWVYNRPSRPEDNQIPSEFAQFLDVPLYQMTTNPNRLVATGGNFMTDGQGTGFSSELILAENTDLSVDQVNDIMHDYLGIERYVLMDELPFDNISHIDMHMKLLDEETLLVGEFPEGVSDGPAIEANLEELLANYPTCYGREYDLVRIPMVPSPSGNWPDGSWSGAHYRTFTNSLILNDLVLVPTYYNSSLNEEALDIYQQAMPGYEIIGIDMESVIPASGAIHCISKEIAATDPVFISHAPLSDNDGNDLQIEAEIKNASGIISASVFYARDGQDSFTEIPMQNNGNIYTANIPDQPCETTINYYISASNAHKTITKPFTAPGQFWSFTIEGEPVEFVSDLNTAETNQEIVFSYTGCLNSTEAEQAVWNFGEGAVPQTASGIEDHTVVYETEGYKTISLTINGEEKIKTNMILITSGQNTFELEILVDGEGITNPSAGTHVYSEGEMVEIEASPAEGWVFENWDINEGTQNSDKDEVVIYMNDNFSVEATFRRLETSVSQWQEKFLFNVYPNPTKGNLVVVMSPSEGPVTIEIVNLQGQVVHRKEVVSKQWDEEFSFDISNQKKGVYFVKLDGAHGSKVKKVVLR
ncbi:MAG: agmatine deiminase family protein [Bacteroidota bacterium]